MPRVIRSAADLLVRALCAPLANMCESVSVEEVASRRWASITFAGEQHRLRLRLEGGRADAAADALLASLAERELDLNGHLVADIFPVSDERDEGGVRLHLEALTVEAR